MARNADSTPATLNNRRGSFAFHFSSRLITLIPPHKQSAMNSGLPNSAMIVSTWVPCGMSFPRCAFIGPNAQMRMYANPMVAPIIPIMLGAVFFILLWPNVEGVLP